MNRLECTGAASLSAIALLFLPQLAQAQFSYSTNVGNTVTITKYTGPGGAVNIPGTIQGLPVTGIAAWAFDQSNPTSITIPASVSDIGVPAFAGSNLTEIAVNPFNPSYSSLDGVLFNKSQTTLIQYPSGRIGDYTVPDGVTSIGLEAFHSCVYLTDIDMPNSVRSIGNYCFSGCWALTNVLLSAGIPSIGDSMFSGCKSLATITIPAAVASIGEGAFWHCTNLTGVFFLGNAPTVSSTVFTGDPAIAYYLPGTTGWGDTFGGVPTATWSAPLLDTVVSFKAKLNFSKPLSDSCKLTVVPRLGQCINWTDTVVTLNIGGEQTSFTLDSKGKGASANGSCRFAYNKRTGACVFTAKLGRGSWQVPWAAHGLVDATIPKPGSSITMPVVLVVQNEAFTANIGLQYTASKGKSGTAR